MKKRFYLISSLMTILFLVVGCSQNLLPNNSSTFNEEYEYEVVNNEIKLIKYMGEYRTLIEIPEEIDGKKVTTISKGCFVKGESITKRQRKNKSSNDDQDNEISDNSTYVIDGNVENIEEGAFDDNSTFVTEKESKPKGWKDSTMQGSGKDGSGNVYYDTRKDDTIVSQGIVYLKDSKRGGIIVARCLTQRKEVEIPAIVDDQKVVDIGREAFSFNDKIEKITIPHTIGEIFSYAFYQCSNLKEIICESSNLSRLMSYSFSGCTSLDVVKLPERCTYLAPKAFSDCGVISTIYMPYSMIHIAETAFYNTTLVKIVYGGTQEQFEKIKIADDVLELFSKIEIEYAELQEKVVLNKLREINDYEDNTFVEFEGIITGFYNQKGVYVTDPSDGFSIWCYNAYGLPFYDEEYIGRKVKVLGTKIHYVGQLEISPAEVELVGEEKTEVTPIELDLSNSDLNISDYLGYYIVVRGEVVSKTGKYIYLDDSDIYLFEFFHWPNSSMISNGMMIEVVGWVHAYNQVYEIMYDSRLVKIIDSASETN